MSALRKASDLRSTGLSVLTCERVDADGHRCAECCESGETLLVYYTVIGARSRQHGGMFCSKDCHDRYHGLKPR